MTLSAKDDKLLYKCEDATGSFAETVVYDGTKTYSDLSGRRSGGVQIAPGFSLDAMHYAPVPAVGFPGVSLLTLAIPGGAVEANRGLFDNCDKYVSRSIWGGAGMTRDYGSIELSTKNSPDPDYGIGCVGSVAESGTRKVLWYYCLNPGAPAFIWEYRKHVLFEGLWLATDIQARFYPRSASAANSTASPLFEIRDYRLVSASPIALPASAFVVADYVPSPSAATDLTGKTAKTFIFLPGRGTPEQQEARQDVIRADRRPVGPPILPRPKATPP